MRKPLKTKRILRSQGSLGLPRIRSEYAAGPVDPHSLWYVYLQALVRTVPWCVSLILITIEILTGAGQNNYLFKLWLMCSSICTHWFGFFCLFKYQIIFCVHVAVIHLTFRLTSYTHGCSYFFISFSKDSGMEKLKQVCEETYIYICSMCQKKRRDRSHFIHVLNSW